MARATSNHDWALPVGEYNSAGGSWAPPHAVGISPGQGTGGANVKWIDNECPGAGTGTGGFMHYGTEYDWLEFWWNLWTADANAYTVAEINTIWNETTGRAYWCCNLDASGVPTSCQRLINTNPTWPTVLTCTRSYPTKVNAGRLWDVDSTFGVTTTNFGTGASLKTKVDDIYNDSGEPLYNHNKYQLFVNQGGFAGVTH